MLIRKCDRCGAMYEDGGRLNESTCGRLIAELGMAYKFKYCPK